MTINRTVLSINVVLAVIVGLAIADTVSKEWRALRSFEGAPQGTTHVTSNIQGVTQASADMREAAKKVSAATAGLSTEAQKLRESVESILSSMRAA